MTRILPQTRAAARALRATLTPQERRLWAKLRELNRMLGTHFRRQAPVGPYVADFADLGRRLIVAVDGSRHGEDAGLRRDMAQDSWMQTQGFTVLRFWNTDLTANLDGVMQVILDAVEASPPREAAR
jgi:very-short-patch-repair endonuclease